MRSITKGLVLATAAASLFISTVALAQPTDSNTNTSAKNKPVRCYGINKCRGHAQCGTKTSNACSGQNSCKGKGWIYVKSAEECISKGGKPL